MFLFIVDTSKSKIHPEINTIQHGQPALFKCFHSNPVFWLFNHKPISDQIKFFENILYISSISEKVAGYYTCVDKLDNHRKIATGELQVEGW